MPANVAEGVFPICIGVIIRKVCRISPAHFFYCTQTEVLLLCDFLVAIHCAVAEFLFDAEELVVFRHTV